MISLSESVEDRCRKKLGPLFNRPPASVVIPNINHGAGYISGRADLEIFLQGGRLLCLEAKGFAGSAYLGDPLQPTQSELKKLGKQYDATGWHTHQRHWWRTTCLPLQVPYWLAWLVGDERAFERFSFERASLFIVQPADILSLEAKLGGRKTVALTAELEREHAYKGITLDREWAHLRLPYHKGAFVLPETHPLHPIVQPITEPIGEGQ